MFVYGADFSSARDPSKGIYYARGEIAPGRVMIRSVVHCRVTRR